MRTCDLAVVGYGPTGMALAALAGGQGHDVVVLERYPGLYNLPRAACFDDEIMRTLQKLQLVDEVRPGTVAQHDYDWVNADGEKLLELTYADPARGGWAALYMMYQPHLERVLDQRCRQLASVEVRQGVAVTAMDAGPDHVVLQTTGADGARQDVQARYVVGADGGEGFVRQALGVGVSDYAFEENWLVCDFAKRRELPAVPTFRQVCDPAQPVSIVRIGPDHQRFSFMLDRHETTERATDPARVWARVRPWMGPEDADLIRVANYVFRSRVADRWRDGRVLLAGDAAHEMPPFLAQGMCSGIRDSHNLAWKLDLILRGQAGPELLDTYQPEREPHVRFITEKAIELGRVQTIRDPAAARARDERLLAQRRARREPEMLLYPGLTGGLVAGDAPGAGDVFPQGRVGAPEGTVGRFDDVVGQGPCVLGLDGAVLAGMDADTRSWWQGLGGHVAVMGQDGVPDAGVTHVTDTDATYGAWMADRGCAAVVVRPDWYCFGAAPDADGLRELLAGLRGRLGAEPGAGPSGVVPGSAQAA